MKAKITMERNDLRYLLSSVSKTLAAEDDADIHLQIENNEVNIASRPGPIQVTHTLLNSSKFNIDTEKTGSMFINIETLIELIKRSTKGRLILKFEDGRYQLKMPEEANFSEPLEFTLPRIAQSDFRPQVSHGNYYMIDNFDRDDLANKLDMYNVLDEHLNIRVEDNTIHVDVSSPVNGSGTISKQITLDSDVTKMSQWYPIRPMRDFIEQIEFAEEVDLRINRDGTLCVYASTEEWKSTLLIARRVDQYTDTELSF